MSVAVPRPLNTSTAMNHPNIASRPSTSTASSSASAGRNSSGKVAIPARPNMNSRASSASTSTVASIAAVGSSSKDTSSSAGKVFAKPSKEWVLPERAKPGRKVCAEEPDNKRQSQNRLSQRAHRARRTDYIQTLEERLRQYEADEIHSNVRLQEVARALKTDNERMKNELMLVRGKMNELAAEREAWEVERKGMQDMCASLMGEVERLRTHVGDASGGGLKLDDPSASASARGIRPVVNAAHRHSHAPQPPSEPASATAARRTGPTVACPICPDPDPDCPCQQPQTAPQIKKVSPPLDCGLCTNPAECLCRAVNESTPPKPVIASLPAIGTSTVKGKCDVCSSLTVCLCEDDSPPPLPAARPAVSLSLHRPAGSAQKTKLAPLWRLDNVVKKGEAVCTGDPENCDACKNDSFGREFCGHLFEQPGSDGTSGVATVKPCNSCPGNCMSISSLLSPARDGGGVVVQPPTPDLPTRQEQEDEEMMRCDEAWKKLKAHPNAKFASLALLADVVAGRTKCTGPTIELSPAPAPSPSPVPATPTPRASSIGVGVPAPPPPPPAMTSPLAVKPISTTSTTGVKRRVAVETSAVRDALRILDSTPSRAASEVEPAPAPVQVKAEPLDLDEVNNRAVKKLRVA